MSTVPLSKGHFCMSSLLSPTPASYCVPEQGESRSFRPTPRAPTPLQPAARGIRASAPCFPSRYSAELPSSFLTWPLPSGSGTGVSVVKQQKPLCPRPRSRISPPLSAACPESSLCSCPPLPSPLSQWPHRHHSVKSSSRQLQPLRGLHTILHTPQHS